MAKTFSYEHQVQFSETDMAGIVHFSNYFKWMEFTENAFFSELKLPLVEFSPEKIAGWPRVNASCQFKAPLRFQDKVEIKLLIKQIRNHSIVYEFEFSKKSMRGSQEVAKGEMTTVYASFDPFKNEIKAALIEETLRETVGEFI